MTLIFKRKLFLLCFYYCFTLRYKYDIFSIFLFLLPFFWHSYVFLTIVIFLFLIKILFLCEICSHRICIFPSFLLLCFYFLLSFSFFTSFFLFFLLFFISSLLCFSFFSLSVFVSFLFSLFFYFFPFSFFVFLFVYLFLWITLWHFLSSPEKILTYHSEKLSNIADILLLSFYSDCC